MTTSESLPQGNIRFAYADVMPIAQKFVAFLERHCTRIVIAGSLRRRKQFVSDIEILYISMRSSIVDPADLFGARIAAQVADLALTALLESGTIAMRPNKNGYFAWGSQNKLAVHVASGIPVDFFETTEPNWCNALVVRTGPSASNVRIASEAKRRGWDWHACGDGFTRGREHVAVKSEHDVFYHVGLPYLEPHERC